MLDHHIAVDVPGDHEGDQYEGQKETGLEPESFMAFSVGGLTHDAKGHHIEGVIIEEREAYPGKHLRLASNREITLIVVVLRFQLADLDVAVDNEHDRRNKKKEVDAFGASASLITHCL